MPSKSYRFLQTIQAISDLNAPVKREFQDRTHDGSMERK